MKISTKGRYGLEAVVDMALHGAGEHHSLHAVAERCGISETYFLHIFTLLKKAGIVLSIRGAQGGYALSRQPADLTVGDVLRALEGPIAPVDCILDSQQEPCDRCPRCASRDFWREIMVNMDAVVDSIPIERLVEQCKLTGTQGTEPEYFI